MKKGAFFIKAISKISKFSTFWNLFGIFVVLVLALVPHAAVALHEVIAYFRSMLFFTFYPLDHFILFSNNTE